MFSNDSSSNRFGRKIILHKQQGSPVYRRISVLGVIFDRAKTIQNLTVLFVSREPYKLWDNRQTSIPLHFGTVALKISSTIEAEKEANVGPLENIDIILHFIDSQFTVAMWWFLKNSALGG